MSKTLADTISGWFTKSKSASLELPNGWFGRPYDNMHMLTFMSVRPHKTLIELDNQLLLVFTDLTTVNLEEVNLVFEDFLQLTFDWQGFGDLKPHATTYNQGKVIFHPSFVP